MVDRREWQVLAGQRPAVARSSWTHCGQSGAVNVRLGECDIRYGTNLAPRQKQRIIYLAGTDQSVQVARDWVAKNAGNTGVGAPSVSAGPVIIQAK